MNNNIRHLGTFFIIVFALIVADLTYWQVIDASSLTSRADNPRLRLQAATTRRGLIFDRNGTLLAGRTIGSNGFVHRYYTDPSLSPVIGYDSDRYGMSELEQADNAYLTGQVAGPSWQTALNQLEHKPVIGDNLTLTIDDRLQRQVDSLMPSGPSAAVVADPRNGQILAMVSHPSFDANQVSNPAYWSSLLNDSSHPLIDRVSGGYYPPGSTFKIVTLSAALDSGIMSLGTTFDGVRATGPLNVDGYVLPQFSSNLSDCGGRVVSPPITLEEALVCSDDIVFAETGLALGSSRFLDYSHRFGFDQVPPFALPVAESRIRTPGEAFTRAALASSAFGQGGIHASPLEMLMVTEAIADNGNIPVPALVKSITAPDGAVIKSAPSGVLYNPIPSGVAADVKAAMVQVVQQGSGILAQIPGVPVAGKTGTAQTGTGLGPHAWFVAFAPADHPRVAVVVLVEHGGEGATVAAPIAKQIMQLALSEVK